MGRVVRFDPFRQRATPQFAFDVVDLAKEITLGAGCTDRIMGKATRPEAS